MEIIFSLITSPTDLNAVVSPDGARLAVLGVGLPEHHPAGLDDAVSFPAHGHHRATVHVGDQPGEEGSGGEVGVVVRGSELGIHAVGHSV